MDFSTHPFSLCIEEERCDLVMQLFGFDPVVVSKFESVGDLLSVFLNRRYYPDLVSLEQIRKLGTRTAHPDKLPWHYSMDYWDHEKVETIIRDIYLSEDEAINALKPSQRFRIHLAFQKDMFACEYVEQPYSYPHPVLEANDDIGRTFSDLSDHIRVKEKVKQEQAMYKAGCQIAEAQNVYMPKQEQYWFAEPQDLIMWLLRYVMEHDKYIKKCEFCGRYFVPKRNTKKYCSEACANTQRDLDSFCGVQEAKQLYKRIVSNLRDKGQRMKDLQLPYHRPDAPGDWIKPQEVLKVFYAENAEYMNDLRNAYEAVKKAPAPTQEQVSAFEKAKATYVDWLQAQYEYATSLELDRDAYFRPD